MDYCEYTAKPETNRLHKKYHDYVYGYPVQDDQRLFERLVLELNQAGLSWSTILKKEENLRRAYHFFDIKKVAAYGEKDTNRLLNDAGIIRNRLKIEAAIHNANQVLKLQKEFSSFKKWLDFHHPKKLKEWVKVFKKNFKFTGGEITNEFLMSTGYLKGAHRESCSVHHKIMKLEPPWNKNSGK